jgi:hypothetical protein
VTGSGSRGTPARGSTKRQPARDVKPHEPRAGDARARDARASGDADRDVVVVRDDDDAPDSRNLAHPAKAPRTADKPAEPRPSSSTGISASELSKLWFDVGTQLGKLPRETARELWGRYELLHYGSLMSATPAERNDAAAKLVQIAAEARRMSP